MEVNQNPVSIHLSKVKNGNTRTMCEICSKVTIKTLERRQCHHRRQRQRIVNLNILSYIQISKSTSIEQQS